MTKTEAYDLLYEWHMHLAAKQAFMDIAMMQKSLPQGVNFDEMHDLWRIAMELSMKCVKEADRLEAEIVQAMVDK